MRKDIVYLYGLLWGGGVEYILGGVSLGLVGFFVCVYTIIPC